MPVLGAGLWDSASRARIEELQWKLAQELLAMGHTVVIEWGTWARSERDTLREGARALGAAVELHFLDAPLDVLFERIRLRKAEDPPVTREDLRNWDCLFQRPCAEEMALFDCQHL
jgi:predicted kinase